MQCGKGQRLPENGREERGERARVEATIGIPQATTKKTSRRAKLPTSGQEEKQGKREEEMEKGKQSENRRRINGI